MFVYVFLFVVSLMYECVCLCVSLSITSLTCKHVCTCFSFCCISNARIFVSLFLLHLYRNVQTCVGLNVFPRRRFFSVLQLRKFSIVSFRRIMFFYSRWFRTHSHWKQVDVFGKERFQLNNICLYYLLLFCPYFLENMFAKLFIAQPKHFYIFANVSYVNGNQSKLNYVDCQSIFCRI